jgi:CRP/FNR family transcriptional regulator
MIKLPYDISNEKFDGYPHVFSVLTNEQLQKIRQNLIIVNYRNNETIIKQDSRAAQAFFVYSGHVKVYIENSREKRFLTGYGKRKDIFGISGLFNGQFYTYTASAVNHLTACFIEYSLLKKTIHENTGFADEIFRLLVKQQDSLQKKILFLSQKQSVGKVAEVLLYLNNEIFNDTNEIQVSRNEIAELTGITKDNAGRVLKDFTENKLLDFDGKTVKILNISKIKDISDFG